MAVAGPGPIDGDDSDMYFGVRVASTERRIRAWIKNFDKLTTPTSGFLGSLLALRALLPEVRGFGVPARSEVEEWREAYQKWFEATENCWANAATANDVRHRTLNALQELHSAGMNMPKLLWAGSNHRAMKLFQHEFTGPNLDFDYDEYQEFARHVVRTRRTVRLWASKLAQVKKADNGFVATVFALRLLVEAAPSPRAFTLASSEVDDWRDKYLVWFGKMMKRFPKAVDPQEVKERSLEEFRRLRTAADDLPKSAWESDISADLTEDEWEGQQYEANLERVLAEDAQPSPQQLEWAPCGLHSLFRTDGSALHFLSFRQFEKCEQAMTTRGVPNDGRVWQGIVKRMLAKNNPRVLEEIKISRQTSMFKAESANLEALRTVRDLIRAVLVDDKLLDEGLEGAASLPTPPPLPTDWEPCNLIPFDDEDDKVSYSLTFCELDEDDPRMESRDAQNDGYTWQRLVKRLLKKRDPKALRKLAFDCESSMFCVRSSTLDALTAVRDIIRAVLADDKVLDEGLNSRNPKK